MSRISRSQWFRHLSPNPPSPGLRKSNPARALKVERLEDRIAPAAQLPVTAIPPIAPATGTSFMISSADPAVPVISSSNAAAPDSAALTDAQRASAPTDRGGIRPTRSGSNKTSASSVRGRATAFKHDVRGDACL